MTLGGWTADELVVDAHVHAWPHSAELGLNSSRTWPEIPAAVGLGTVVRRVVVVTPGNPPGDDAWTLQLADNEGTHQVVAVVRASSLHLVTARYGGNRHGVRVVLDSLPASKETERVVDEAAAHGVPVHVQNTVRDWSAVHSWARSRPQATFLVDHLGHPDLAAGPLDPRWREFCALAEHANVAAKLPILPFFAGSLETAMSLGPFVSAALHAYGRDRLLWASDWPNSATATYRQLLDAGLRLVTGVDEEAVAPVFAGNATRLLWGGPDGS